MMQVSAQPFISEAHTRENIRRLHLTLRAGGARPERKALPAPVVEKAPVARPMWKTQELHFDHHMRLWKQQVNRYGHPKYQAYIRRRCDEACVSYEDVVSRAMNRRLTTARQDIMLGLRMDFTPPPSFAHIGRLLGGRDFSTCSFGAKAAAERAALPAKTFRTQMEMLYGTPSLANAIRRDFYDMMPFSKIGAKHGLQKTIIAKFAKEMGWGRLNLTTQSKKAETPLWAEELAIELYHQGFPCREIAKRCNIGERTITMIRHRRGIPSRPR